MDLWLVVLLYVVGMGLMIAEALLPGVVMGLLGATATGVSVYFGFQYHWGIGLAQVGIAAAIIPTFVWFGVRRLSLRQSLEGSVSFARDYSECLGREGETLTDLRPAGMILLDGKRLDVVTAGEPVEKGRKVRVVKVEGNRVVVRAI